MLLEKKRPEWKGRIIFRPNKTWVMSVTVKGIGTVYCELERLDEEQWADAVIYELDHMYV